MGVSTSSLHGLNRKIELTSLRQTVRAFYIPQYLGTAQSETKSIGIDTYLTVFTIENKDSYYWNKYKGKTEKAVVNCYIYLTNTADDPDEPKGEIPSILDELRTKIKVRLK